MMPGRIPLRALAVTALAVACCATPMELQKRECEPMDVGSGPIPSPDTYDAFVAYQPFSDAANSAITPAGYINTYTDLLAESAGLGFMGYSLLDSYDTSACAARCDAHYECMAFNIAFERSPSVNPGPDCSNPNSTTWIKCTLWGGPVNIGNAVNYGQYRNGFTVVAAGSNGYVNQSIMDASSYYGPEYDQGGAINAPKDCNGLNTLLFTKSWFDGMPFDAARCAARCTGYSGCQFFNTYALNANYSYQGQFCALYSERWDSSLGSLQTVTVNGLSYSVTHSYSFTNTTNPGYCQGKNFWALGCYKDNGARVLPVSKSLPSGTKMTVEQCSCACMNYTYFGIEYSQECYCGNSLADATSLGRADNCNMGCQGNSSEACGGGWALNLYQQGPSAIATCTAPVAQCSNPGTCGSYTQCNPSEDCYCGYDTSKNAICFQDESCDSSLRCNSNSDCSSAKPSCLLNNCCGFNICSATNICLNGGSKIKRILMGRQDPSAVSAVNPPEDFQPYWPEPAQPTPVARSVE